MAEIDEHDSLQRQLDTLRRRENILLEKKAGYGTLSLPPHLQIELEDTQADIKKLEAHLAGSPTGIDPAQVRPYLESLLATILKEEVFTREIVSPDMLPGSREPTEPLPDFVLEQIARYSGEVIPYYSRQAPQPDTNREKTAVEDFLAQYTRIVLLGEPGAGKSTALRRLTLQLSRYWLEDNPSCPAGIPEKLWGKIPLFAPLNRWQKEQSLEEFLRKELETGGGAALAEKLEAHLKAGRFVLLLDGLNELPGIERDEEKDRQITDERAKRLARLSETPTYCVISCRRNDFGEANDWYDLHVLPLEEGQVREIARNYYRRLAADKRLKHLKLAEKAERFGEELYGEGERKKKLREMASRPFYLNRMLFAYVTAERLEDNPAKLLEKSVEDALNKEAARELKAGNIRDMAEWGATELKVRLALLAFNMTEARQVSTGKEQAILWLYHQREKTKWDEDTGLEKIVKPALHSNQRIEAANWLEKGEKAGLLTFNGDEVKFSHQLLLEFFCARLLIGKSLDIKWLDRIAATVFKDIWPLYIALKPDVLEILFDLLKHKEWRARANSTIAIGWSGDIRAVEPLILALKDPDAELRFNAAWALGRIRDARAVEPLILALKDEVSTVRYYAANALGEIEDGRAVEPLILALKDTKSNVCYKATEALGRIGDGRALPELGQVARDDEWEDQFGRKLSDMVRWAIEEIKKKQGSG